MVNLTKFGILNAQSLPNLSLIKSKASCLRVFGISVSISGIEFLILVLLIKRENIKSSFNGSIATIFKQ